MRLNPEMKTKQRMILAALAPIAIFGALLYGLRVILLCLTAMAVCSLLDAVCYRMRRLRMEKGDLSAAITGLILALLMPASVPVSILLFACFTAICIAKHPFGGFGRNAFNPAAVGFSLSLVFWPQQLLNYPVPLSNLNVYGSYETLMPGALASLGNEAVPAGTLTDLIFGQFPGPIAQSSVLLLLGCLLFLLLSRTVEWRIPVFAAVTCILFAFAFPRADYTRLLSPVYELSSGCLFFGLIFMATDPVTLPQTGIGRSFCGVMMGLAAMLMRIFGQFQLGFCFALLLINALAPVMDKGAAWLNDRWGDAKRSTRTLIKREKRYSAAQPIRDDEPEDTSGSEPEDHEMIRQTQSEIRSFLDRVGQNDSDRREGE